MKAGDPGRRETPGDKVLKKRRSPRQRGRMGTSVIMRTRLLRPFAVVVVLALDPVDLLEKLRPLPLRADPKLPLDAEPVPSFAEVDPQRVDGLEVRDREVARLGEVNPPAVFRVFASEDAHLVVPYER